MIEDNQKDIDQLEAPKAAFFTSKKARSDSAGVNNMEENEKKSGKKIRWWMWIFIGILIVMMMTGFGSYRYVKKYQSAFETASGVQLKSMIEVVKKGWKSEVFAESDRVNILVFGIDQVGNQRGESQLTDSIILVSIDKFGRVDLISLPRDLWINSLKTKINALYYYGEISGETTGEELLSSVVEEISGTRIDYVMLLNLENVSQVIDAIDGVEVEVVNSFVDEKYPRSNVDISSQDPDLLYETVSFEKGVQQMDGERAMKYIRSRNSQSELEGNDVARSIRQQQVIMAIVRKMEDKYLWTNPVIAGEAYSAWKAVETDLEDEVLIGLAKELSSQELGIRTHTMTQADELENELLTNPPISKYDQWVYEPVDSTWQQLQIWFQQQLQAE